MSTVTVIVVAIVGVALLAVLLSQNANTSNVIGTAGSGFASILSVALSPVTGGNSGF